MKKVFLFSSLLALGAVASYADAVIPTPIDTCSPLGTIAAIKATASGSCEVGDKVFSNFNYTGPGTTADVDVQGTLTVATETFGLQFTSNLTTAFNAAFTLSFNIAIDQTACLSLYGSSSCVITGTQDQIQGGLAGASNTATLVGTHTGGTISLNELTTAGETGQISGLNLTTMADSFVGSATTNWPITRLGTEVFQQAVPEPMTFSLMGAGLLGLGLLRKRISRS